MLAERWINRAASLAVLFAAAVAFLAATVTMASAEDIRISLDQAVPIRINGAAEGIAIGNPNIAGVSVQDDRMIFVTGRSYGTTNLVIVGNGGRVIYSGRVSVVPDEEGVVMVTRGGATSRLECSPICRPRPDIGDSAEAFQAARGQITGRVDGD